MNRSTTLGWIDGSDADERLELTLRQGDAGSVEFVMSEQHFAEGIGWFTQRSLSLDPQQVAQLKRMLQVNDVPRGQIRSDGVRNPPATLKLIGRTTSEDKTPLAEVG